MRAIITGADSGIGKATAVLLAERGWDVGFTFHADPEGAEGTAAEIEAHGRRAVSRPLDLIDPAAGPPAIEALAPLLDGEVSNLAGYRAIRDAVLAGSADAAQDAADALLRPATEAMVEFLDDYEEDGEDR